MGAVMSLPGHARACAGSMRMMRGGRSRTRAALREISDLLGAEGRAVSPINAVEKRRQAATRASGLGFGRTEAICEKDEIMQILPGSRSDAGFINLPGTFCNQEVLRHHTRSEAGLAILFLTGRWAVEQPYP